MESASQDRETLACIADRIQILVVDDEESIGKSLKGVFDDEGYLTLLAGSGREALDLLAVHKPSVILLDVWMPGMDGITALREIKSKYPDIPVIMISGHATIATAMRATKIGAADFIEKPLDLDGTIKAVKKVLGLLVEEAGNGSLKSAVQPDAAILEIKGEGESFKINPVVFEGCPARGRERPQRTLKHSSLLYGQGLHTGEKSGLILEPLPPDSGVHFCRVSDPVTVPAHIDYVESTGFATTVKFGDAQAGTIEHIMSALHAYGITNLLVKCNGEVPVMDGSSGEFCSLIEEVGLEEQDRSWFDIKVREKVRVGDNKEFIQIEPCEEFIVDYTLQYPEPVGRQHLEFTLESNSDYRIQIAGARTFGFVRDIEWLQKQGLALGGRFDNFVLFGDEGPINCELRYPDEPVRHKILDAIGDLYLLGRRIQGRVTAHMTGHSDNIALLNELKRKMARWADI